jgi:hypothetical protein
MGNENKYGDVKLAMIKAERCRYISSRPPGLSITETFAGENLFFFFFLSGFTREARKSVKHFGIGRPSCAKSYAQCIAYGRGVGEGRDRAPARRQAQGSKRL